MFDQNSEDFSRSIEQFFDHLVGEVSVGLQTLTNMDKFPYLEEIVRVLNIQLGVYVVYAEGPEQYHEMHAVDAAEAWDNGYRPEAFEDGHTCHLKSTPTSDLSEFWRMFEYYKKNPPMRAIRQIQAIDHLEDIVMFYQESKYDELTEHHDDPAGGKALYDRIYIPKMNFLRQVKRRTLENLKNGI